MGQNRFFPLYSATIGELDLSLSAGSRKGAWPAAAQVLQFTSDLFSRLRCSVRQMLQIVGKFEFVLIRRTSRGKYVACSRRELRTARGRGLNPVRQPRVGARSVHMGIDQSKLATHGEKDRGGKNRKVEGSVPAGSDGKPDLPQAYMSKFSKALLAQMKADIGDLAAIMALINTESYTVSGKVIDSVKDAEGLTVLHRAVLSEKTLVVKFLLECGCQPRTLSHSWQTALHDAILKGNHDIVLLLLEFGAPNVCLSTNATGELPIHLVRLPIASFAATNNVATPFRSV